jgi:cell division protein FtsI (penicillin-binding protein 3)
MRGKKERNPRGFWLPAVFLLAAVLVLGQLINVTVVQGASLKAQAAEKYTKTTINYAKRGTIYDCNMKILAISVDCTTIYADCTEVSDPAATSQLLSHYLGGSAADYLQLLTKNPAARFVYLKKDASKEQASALQAENSQLKQQYIASLSDPSKVPVDIPTALSGIGYLAATKREYPYGSVGAQVIGAVSTKDDPGGGTQLTGISGIELAYDAQLKGVNGYTTAETAKDGTPIAGGAYQNVDAQDGQDLVLSIDINLQSYVEKELKATAKQAKRDQGTATVMDGATGRIYAAASLPLYNRGKLTTKAVNAGATNLQQITSSYEPGSVFKGLTFATALETHQIKPSTRIHVPSKLPVDTYTIRDSHDHPAETLTAAQILAQSSNIGTSLIKERINNDTYAAYLHKYGIGEVTHVDYPGERSGTLADPKTWPDSQALNISFGQGVTVTPLQIASFYGILASGGTQVQPHFVISAGGTPTTPAYQNQQVVSASTVKDMDSMLKGVVTDGTGKRAAVAGYTAAGKTGTAQIASPSGGYQKGNYNVSFVGYLSGSGSALTCMCTMDKQPSVDVVNPTPGLFSKIMAKAASLYHIQPS